MDETSHLRLTGPQAEMLAVLCGLNDRRGPTVPPRGVPPRQLAMRRWPNSPAWKRLTRVRGSKPGALGGTMPMKAATVLWKLEAHGLATREGTPYDRLANLWLITDAGRRWLDANATAGRIEEGRP